MSVQPASSRAHCFTWKSYRDRLLDQLGKYLMTGALVDVTIVCADKTIGAHRLILCAMSDYFQKMIFENPCKRPCLIMSEFPSWILEALLTFMYTGTVTVADERVADFMAVGQKLQVKGLWEDNNNKYSPEPTSDGRRKQRNPQKCVDAVEEAPPKYREPDPYSGAMNPMLRDLLNQKMRKFPAAAQYAAAWENQQAQLAASSLVEPPHLVATKEPPKVEEVVETQEQVTPKVPRGRKRGSRGEGAQEQDPDFVTPKVRRGSSRGRPRDAKRLEKPPETGMAPTQQRISNRRWTEEDLNRALDDVGSGRSNTSQASRQYNIPYNSLLGYVKGKHKRPQPSPQEPVKAQTPEAAPPMPAPVPAQEIPAPSGDFFQYNALQNFMMQQYMHSSPQE